MCQFLSYLDRLNPLFQVATLVALIVYVWKTWTMARATSEAAAATQMSLQELKLTREQQIRPYVICYFQHSSDPSLYELVIRNTGESMAFDVDIAFSPPLQEYLKSNATSSPVASRKFKALPPGYEWRTLWGSFIGIDKAAVPDSFDAKVSYNWGTNRKHESYTISFDLKSLMGKHYAKQVSIENSLEKLIEIIERIERKLSK